MGAFVLKDGLAQELLEKGSPIPGIVFLRTGDGIIELNSIHASKGNALCTLCKKLGISMEMFWLLGITKTIFPCFRLQVSPQQWKTQKMM